MTKAKIRKSYVGTARAMWPNAEWVSGNGPYASVSECHDRPTVSLFGTEAEAEAARMFIDRRACGGACVRAHRVVYLGKLVDGR